MELIREEYYTGEKFEEFKRKFEKISFSDFSEDYGNEDCDQKKLRNDYQNRLKKTNLMIYFMDYENADQSVEISNLNLKITKLEQKIKELEEDEIEEIKFDINEL